MTVAEQLGRRVLLDANLLLVLVVGLTDRSLIETHKRTGAYEPEDYDFIVESLRHASVITTPHILTEVSNLGCSGLTGTTLKRFLGALKSIITGPLEEQVIVAKSIVEASVFGTLGLTDAGIERIAELDVVVLTGDAPLYARLVGRGLKAVNYNHVRPAFADIR